MRRLLLALVVSLAFGGCTTRSGVGSPDAHFDLADATIGTDASTAPDATRTDAGPDLSNVLIYAHSRDTLFSFSPFTSTVASIGRFTLPGGADAPFMTDLAVNSANEIYTSSETALFRVDADSAVATPVAEFGGLGTDVLYALTFVQPGTLGPNETLIGATNEGVYYRIDPTTAAATRLGQYPDGWRSSGDLVNVDGLGTYATVRRADTPTDVLARIQFRADGSSSVTVLGETGYVQLFGLGYWGRALYGFSNAGELLEINRDTGAATVATSMTGTMQFWGAGVTTRVPVLF